MSGTKDQDLNTMGLTRIISEKVKSGVQVMVLGQPDAEMQRELSERIGPEGTLSFVASSAAFNADHKLPMPSATLDWVILSGLDSSKEKFFLLKECYRVLQPGAWLLIEEEVLVEQEPLVSLNTPVIYGKKEYLRMIDGAGFDSISIVNEEGRSEDESGRDTGVLLMKAIVLFAAQKPDYSCSTCAGF